MKNNARFLFLLCLVLAIPACSSADAPQEIEVTRIVEVTRLVEAQIEVTRLVEVEKEVEVTRISAVTATPEPAPTPFSEVAIEAASFVTGTHDISTLPVGEGNEVEVILVGEMSQFFAMPIILRNNSNLTIARTTASVTASTQDGQLLATADLSNSGPNVVPPGGYILGQIFFGPDANLPEDVVIEIEADAKDAADNRFENIRDLPIIEFNLVGDSIVGRLENIYDEEIDLMSIQYVCFDSDGNLSLAGQDFVDQEMAAAGDIVPFEVDLLSRASDCATYLLSARGFGDF